MGDGPTWQDYNEAQRHRPARPLARRLLAGGWLGVDLFGLRDDWGDAAELNFHPRAGIDQLLAGLEVLDVREEERDGPAFGGATKHWHVFHCLARRPREPRD